MVIKEIKTSGFRKHENKFETNLYNITQVTGKNTSGKTNILYAIVWAFLGSNLTGDERVWLGNDNKDNCYVEIKFIDNEDKEHTLVRSKNKFDTRKNFIMLDNREVKQENLVSFYNDKKLFLSIINPSYFINKKPAEQKEMLDKYLPQVDVKNVYNRLESSEKQLIGMAPSKINGLISDLRDEKKFAEDKIKNLKGKIEYAETIAKEIIENEKTFEKEEELSLAMQELSFLKSDKGLVNNEKQKQILNSLQIQLKNLKDEIDILSKDMEIGKKNYLKIKNEEESICPTCKQTIVKESKIETIRTMREELVYKNDHKKELEIKFTDLQIQIDTEKCKLYALNENANLFERIADVEKQISNLEKEKEEINNYNNLIIMKKRNAIKASNDIKLYEENISQLNNSIESIEKTIKVAQKLYINYIEEKMKYAKRYLKDVCIKYYTVLKETGELKDDFIITYKDTELKNLSKSETIATSLELSNMLNKISGINVPLFIDDSESCTDYNFIEKYADDTQIIIAQAKKGEDLQVVDYEQIVQENFLQVA